MTEKEYFSPLSDGVGSKSQCYECRHWDWGLTIGIKSWIHVCRSPIEGLVPGDCVINCEGFEFSKKDFGLPVDAPASPG